MAANTVVQARVNDDIKTRAAAVLSEMGLSISDVIRLTLTRVANERSYEYPPVIPNATTIAALQEPRESMESASSVEEFMARMNADD